MTESNAGIGAAVTAMVGLVGLPCLLRVVVVDLFTIPRQVTAYNENLELDIITSLNTGIKMKIDAGAFGDSIG